MATYHPSSPADTLPADLRHYGWRLEEREHLGFTQTGFDALDIGIQNAGHQERHSAPADHATDDLSGGAKDGRELSTAESKTAVEFLAVRIPDGRN